MYCNPIDLITCVGEIESAFEDCSHAGSADDIFKCIEEIIGAGNQKYALLFSIASHEVIALAA